LPEPCEMIRTTITCLFCTIVLPGSCGEHFESVDDKSSGHENRCGQESLLVAAEFMGLSVDAETLASAADSEGRPMTMLELKVAAERLGLSCLPLQWESGLELPAETVAIIVLRARGNQPSHYVVVTSRIAGRYQILDYGRPPIYVPLGTLLRDWTGQALHLARSEQALRPLWRTTTARNWRMWGLLFMSGVVVCVVLRLLWSNLRRESTGVVL
jgi:ABC-type bacteriocin/lantibiotic exporter with double-glycine peptidase domain